jgi:hypothetical protein
MGTNRMNCRVQREVSERRLFFLSLALGSGTVVFLGLLCVVVLNQKLPATQAKPPAIGEAMVRQDISQPSAAVAEASDPVVLTRPVDGTASKQKESETPRQSPLFPINIPKELGREEEPLPENRFGEVEIADPDGKTILVKIPLAWPANDVWWNSPVRKPAPPEHDAAPIQPLPPVLETVSSIFPLADPGKPMNQVVPQMAKSDPIQPLPANNNQIVPLLIGSKMPRPPAVKEFPDGQYQISFMGAPAKGKRFCFILDRSRSMTQPMPATNPKTGQPVRSVLLSRMDVLKLELAQTLRSLPPGSECCVILYNHEVLLTPAGLTWRKGGDDAVQISNWVNRVPPDGNTNPMPAFYQALMQMNPRPDVIYFMTDGEIPSWTLQQVTAMNRARQPGASVHTIQIFGNQPYMKNLANFVPHMQEQMNNLAEWNGGQYHGYRLMLNLP